jgi:hypothetical protein
MSHKIQIQKIILDSPKESLTYIIYTKVFTENSKITSELVPVVDIDLTSFKR